MRQFAIPTRMHERGGIPVVRRGGFTLIELLVVIAIIAILIGILVLGFGALARSARSVAVAQDVAALKNGVTQFKNEFGFLPPLVRDLPAADRLDRSSDPARVSVWDPASRDRTAAQEAQEALRDPDARRFSEHSLAYFIAGALDAQIDGVEGVGFRKPRTDGAFETRGREYQPFFDPGAGGSSQIVQRGADLTQGDVVIVDRYATPYRYYRWLPNEGQAQDLQDLNIPEILGDPAELPELRTAEFAIVSAGRNQVFGDEDLVLLRDVLRQSNDVPEEVVRRLAREDNIVEFGR